jgi:TIR domain
MKTGKDDNVSLDHLFGEADRLMSAEDYKSALVLYDRIDKVGKGLFPAMGKVKALWALGYLREAAECYKKFKEPYPYDDMVFDFADFVIKLVEEKPMRFCSCFISYASEDQQFADRLYVELQSVGINCWKWDHDAKTGRDLWAEIDDAIRKHEKVVLVASRHSLVSPAVNREIERAIRLEDERQKKKALGQYLGDTNVLFPVTLDGYIFDKWQHERKPDVIKKVVADAKGWKTNKNKYRELLERLKRDLVRE